MSNWESKLLQRSEGAIKGFLGHEADLVTHAAEQALVNQMPVAPLSSEVATGEAVSEDLVNELATKILAALAGDIQKDVAEAIAALKPLTEPVGAAATTGTNAAWAAATLDTASAITVDNATPKA